MDAKPKRPVGRPPTGHTESVHLYLSPALLEAIDAAAKAEGVTRAEWLRRAAVDRLPLEAK